jgi:hypothetical protein
MYKHMYMHNVLSRGMSVVHYSPRAFVYRHGKKDRAICGAEIHGSIEFTIFSVNVCRHCKKLKGDK